MTIRYKLSLSIGVPLLITYLGMLGWDYHRQRETAMEQMQQSVLERADRMATQLDTRLNAIMQSAESTAALLQERPSLGEVGLRVVLGDQIRRSPWAESLSVVTEPGEGANANAGVGVTVGRRGGLRRNEQAVTSAAASWYAQVKATRQAAWSVATTQAGTSGNASGPTCIYAVPILSSGQFRGAVAVNVPVTELRQLRGRPFGGAGGPGGPPVGGPGGGFGESNRADRPAFGTRNDFGGPTSRPNFARGTPFPEPNGDPEAGPPPPELAPVPAPAPTLPTTNVAAESPEAFAIFDQTGRVLTAPDDGQGAAADRLTLFEVSDRLGQTPLADAARAALAGKSQVVQIAGLHDVLPSVPADTHHWVAFAPVTSTGWAIVTAIPQSTVMDPLLAQIWQRAAFLFAGSGVLMLVVFAVSVRISRPIERLAGAVDRLASGELDTEVTGIPGRDELGRLASAFNHMTGQLRSHIAAMTEQAAAREKAEGELRVARQIQTDMLPKTFPPFPDRREFDLHAINRPALGVAGDFYDFFFTPDGLLTLVVADVSGKGIPAALLMAVTRTVVRNLSHAGLSLAQIVERANAALLADTSAHMFVTMLLCQYDPATGRLTYVNAGHPPGFRIAQEKAPSHGCGEISSPLLGVAGVDVLGPFEQGEETLAPGESLVLFTDGVTEARSPAGEMLGDAGLRDYLATHDSFAPAELCRDLAAYVDAFEGGHRHDDLTLLVLRRAAR